MGVGDLGSLRMVGSVLMTTGSELGRERLKGLQHMVPRTELEGRRSSRYFNLTIATAISAEVGSQRGLGGKSVKSQLRLGHMSYLVPSRG